MYLGDFALGSTLDFGFSTVDSTGAPITLAGTPSLAAYVGNSTTQITAGITLTVDFDSVTGMHNVRVVASSGNGYAAQTNVRIVIEAGTVDSVSVVGYTLAHFSIENRSALRPATAGRTLGVDASNRVEGIAGTINTLDALDTAQDSQHATTQGKVDTAQADIDILTGTDGATLATSQPNYAPATAAALATAQNDLDTITGSDGVTLATTQGNYAPATAAQATAIETDTQDIQGRIPAALVGGRIDANAGAISGDATAADNLEAALDGTGGVTITAGLTGNVTGNLSGSVGSVTGAVGSVTGNVGGNVVGSVASVTGAVGSVTGNVGGDVVGSVNGNVDGTVASVVGGVGGTVGGVAGTITTLDALDTAQDSQHATTQSALSTAASNVATILGKFTGITLLAEWLGLIAGKQTGNSTARTELRATGAGSGTYDETTDSLEAARDNTGTAGAGLTEAGGTGDHLTELSVTADVEVDEAAIAAEVVAGLGGASVVVSSAISKAGALTIEQGDDYSGTDLQWTITGFEDLTGSTMTFRTRDTTKAITLVSTGGASQVVRLTLTDEETAAMSKRSEAYKLRAVMSDGRIKTPVRGTISLTPDLPGA